MIGQQMIRPDGTTVHLIHFVYLKDMRWVVACAPGMIDDPAMKWKKTDDPRATTCCLCQSTDEYQEKAERLR